jgi:hypothetical protein
LPPFARRSIPGADALDDHRVLEFGETFDLGEEAITMVA